MNNPEKQTTLWLGAFRYYLGRMSYAVSDFVEILIENWDSLPDKTKFLISKELTDAFTFDDSLRLQGHKQHLPLGMDCDRAEWFKLMKLINLEKENLPTSR